jgi:hypothetical protein
MLDVRRAHRAASVVPLGRAANSEISGLPWTSEDPDQGISKALNNDGRRWTTGSAGCTRDAVPRPGRRSRLAALRADPPRCEWRARALDLRRKPTRVAVWSRFQMPLPPPEADPLSPELRGRGLENTWQKTSRGCRDRGRRPPLIGSNVVFARSRAGCAEFERVEAARCVSAGGDRLQAASAVGRRRRWRWSASPLTIRA